MKPIRAVIFDLDGTLLNTLDDLAGAVNHALALHGYPTRTLDEVRRFVGNGIANLIHRALPDGVDAEREAAVLADFRTYYAAHDLDATAPYAGVREMLCALHEAGIPMAVVSNKIESAVETLRQHFFADTIAVAIGDHPSRPRKPAPDGTYAALARLGVSADEAIFVGDSEVDVDTARNADMRLLAVTWGFRDVDTLRARGATQFADTPAEAARYLLGKK